MLVQEGEDPGTLCELGTLLWVKKKEYKQAEELYRRALRVNSALVLVLVLVPAAPHV